jgi:competence protein ComEA
MTTARLPVFLAMGTLAVVILGLVFFGFTSLDARQGGEIVIRDPRADATIVVSVIGAVATPGLYTLGPGARVHDALVAAGDLTGDADAAAVNPAAPLVDGQQLVIPTQIPLSRADPDATPAVASSGSRQESDSAFSATLINLNTASAAELETLPGIGPVLAAAIVADREAVGPYRSVDDLARVSGISTGIIEELRSLGTV